jgi:hypothetical protein
MQAFLVVSASFNTFAAEFVTQIGTLSFALLAPPALHDMEHLLPSVASTVFSLFTKRRVVEDSMNDAVDSAINVRTLVVPALHDLWNYPLQNLAGNFARWLIQQVGKMIFRDHRMSWISRVVIAEHNVLLFPAALDDFRRSSCKFGLDLFDHRQDKWSYQRKHENTDLLLQTLNQVWKYGDLFDRFGDGVHNFIVELENRIDLLANHVHLLGKGFWFFWTDMHVLPKSISQCNLLKVSEPTFVRQPRWLAARQPLQTHCCHREAHLGFYRGDL